MSVGESKRMGRPPAADPKVPINARVPKSLKERCEAAAESSGMTWSDWVRIAIESFVDRPARKRKASR